MRLTLTKQAEYAVRILVWLAQTQADESDERALAASTALTRPPELGAIDTTSVAMSATNGAVSSVGAASSATVPQDEFRSGGRQKAAAIASAINIPPLFAARVLALMQRQGLLHARAGQQGGYTLVRHPQTISILEVVEAVEGPLLSRDCVMRDQVCGAGDFCVLHDAWSASQEALRAVLATSMVGSTISRSGTASTVPPERVLVASSQSAVGRR